MPKTDKFAEATLKLIFWNSVVTGDTPDGPNVLDHFGAAGTAITKSSTDGTLHISLHTSSPGYGGNPTTNEISYTGYSRISVARTDAAWAYSTTGGPNMSNIADLSWGLMTAGTGGVARFWGIGLDGTSGAAAENLLYFGALALEVPKPFSVVDTGSDNIIVSPGHGLASNDQVQFVDAGGGVIPAGLTEGTWYYVIFIDADTFRVSAASGPGSSVGITGAGAGYLAKALEKSVAVNDEPTLKAGKCIVYER